MSKYMQKLLSLIILISLASILLVEASRPIKYYEWNGIKHFKGNKHVPIKIYDDDCEADSPCLKPSGLNPNPLDCCSFYNCDRCRAFLQKCGKGTQFNPKLLVCDYPETAGCEADNTYCHQTHYVKKTQHVEGNWS